MDLRVSDVIKRPKRGHGWTGLAERFPKPCGPSSNSKGRPNASGPTAPTSGGAAMQISDGGKGLTLVRAQNTPSFAPSALPRRASCGPSDPIAFGYYAATVSHVKESAPEGLLDLCLSLRSGHLCSKAKIRRTGGIGRARHFQVEEASLCIIRVASDTVCE